jgi:hypothetical protein
MHFLEWSLYRRALLRFSYLKLGPKWTSMHSCIVSLKRGICIVNMGDRPPKRKKDTMNHMFTLHLFLLFVYEHNERIQEIYWPLFGGFKDQDLLSFEHLNSSSYPDIELWCKEWWSYVIRAKRWQAVKWTKQEMTLATECLQQLFENTRKPRGNFLVSHS